MQFALLTFKNGELHFPLIFLFLFLFFVLSPFQEIVTFEVMYFMWLRFLKAYTVPSLLADFPWRLTEAVSIALRDFTFL